jgi:hypothetical protein
VLQEEFLELGKIIIRATPKHEPIEKSTERIKKIKRR